MCLCGVYVSVSVMVYRWVCVGHKADARVQMPLIAPIVPRTETVSILRWHFHHWSLRCSCSSALLTASGRGCCIVLPNIVTRPSIIFQNQLRWSLILIISKINIIAVARALQLRSDEKAEHSMHCEGTSISYNVSFIFD